MAKEVEGSNEPSQSSSTLPPLAENEVELVIERFWRDTRPRVCVRSETKQVNGFNFRLLVWPQGSKQSQSHLSAFVEVVPPSVVDTKKESEEGSKSGAMVSSARKLYYPPDWACPCVFYRISVMNFKQKYPYSKADTWTFSYVCPDRGWHTLLDTRYINRRDGYLSNEGSLVIRAIAFPRFGHAISVLPLLSDVVHGGEDSSRSSCSHHFGLGNFMATDHVNCLIQSLFHLPGFRKVIYSLRNKRDGGEDSVEDGETSEAELDVIQQGLESCAETIKEIMTRVSNASPEISRMIQAEFIKDCIAAGLCGKEEVHRKKRLGNLYGRCRVLINCLEESLFSVSQSLFGRKRSTAPESGNKRAQFEAYRQIVRECKRILATVVQSLFVVSVPVPPAPKRGNLIEELQLIFAKLEYGQSASFSRLIDTRGFLRELGVTSGGILSAASPDGLFVVFFEALKKAALEMNNDAWTQISKIFNGKIKSSANDEQYSGQEAQDKEELEEEDFSYLRLGSQKATSVEKHIASWSEEESSNRRISALPSVLTLQFLSKVKDRLDITERLSLQIPPRKIEDQNLTTSTSTGEGGWETFLSHECVGDFCPFMSFKPKPIQHEGKEAKIGSSEYRLHSVYFSSGGELSSAHFSAIVRNNRAGGWTRFDDAFVEELIDVSGGGPAAASSSTSSCPDWVFSPEWSCCSATFVREDQIEFLYQRGVDVRLIRPDIFSRAISECANPSMGAGIESVLCNRRCSPPSPVSGVSSVMTTTTTTTNLDASCQVEVCLITEKDVLAAASGGFTVPFTFSVSNVSRKLIVRKDIPTERLMQAVAEHFKIPVQMQRLFALRYYPETAQDRFELMQPNRAVLGYLALETNVGKDRSCSSSVASRKSMQSSSSCTASQQQQLYVLVSASRSAQEVVTVWIKVLDETKMGLVSVCLLSMDPNEPLRNYFDQVVAKATSRGCFSSTSTTTNGGGLISQFIVFEEIAPRQVEIKRSCSPIKNERIMNGDILIFVPLTDLAKRSLIAATSSSTVRYKRRTLAFSPRVFEPPSTLSKTCGGGPQLGLGVVDTFDDSESSAESSSFSDQDNIGSESGLRFGKDDQDEAEDDSSSSSSCCSSDLGGEEEVNERCKRFLTRAAHEEDKAIVRRYLRSGDRDRGGSNNKDVVVPKLADIMSDIMREFDGGDDEDVLAVKRRLEVPQQLKDELNRVAACSISMCFYCQLPLGAGGPRPFAKVACSAGCVPDILTYHARCVQELVSETGSSACIITEGCCGKICVEPKSLISKLVREDPPRLSLAALRAKVGKMLEMPPVPHVVQSTGQVVVGNTNLPVQWKGKGKCPPPIPSGIKICKKSPAGGKKQLLLQPQLLLPLEPLWYNACLLAFGGIDGLHTVVKDQHWDAADLSQAKSIFSMWCKILLEKHHPVASKRAAGARGHAHYNYCANTQNQLLLLQKSNQSSRDDDDSEQESESGSDSDSDSSVCSRSERSSSSETGDDKEEEERRKKSSFSVSIQLQSPTEEDIYSNDDNDDIDGGFILVGASSKKDKRTGTSIDTPTEASLAPPPPATPPPSIVIPKGFLGTAPSSNDDEEAAAAACIAEETVSSLLVSEVFTPPPPTTCALLESRMNLLPMAVRQFCLPVQLVFVYFSEQFFATLPNRQQATTVSLIPPPGREETVKIAINLAVHSLSLSIHRLFTSPHQIAIDSPVSVQWFVDFDSVTDALRFTKHVSCSHPDWGPETGALLPASLLGFAV